MLTYDPQMLEDSDGAWVRYEDHAALLEAAQRREAAAKAAWEYLCSFTPATLEQVREFVAAPDSDPEWAAVLAMHESFSESAGSDFIPRAQHEALENILNAINLDLIQVFGLKCLPMQVVRFACDKHAAMTQEASTAKGQHEVLEQRCAGLEEALRRACEAGLKLGSECKLNPGAYISQIREAFAVLRKEGA